jgi:outer membrane protein assembly factor BamA
VLRSTADSILNARRGYQGGGASRGGGSAPSGQFNYLSLSADGRHYVPINRSLVVANRLQLGNISPVNGTAINVPFAKRYFLGGASSLRGWGRYEVSPLSETGLPLGAPACSVSRLNFAPPSTAVSVPCCSWDAGTRGWTRGASTSAICVTTSVPVSANDTPIGPLRFDVGYQLNPIPNLTINGEPQTRRWRIPFQHRSGFLAESGCALSAASCTPCSLC